MACTVICSVPPYLLAFAHSVFCFLFFFHCVHRLPFAVFCFCDVLDEGLCLHVVKASGEDDFFFLLIRILWGSFQFRLTVSSLGLEGIVLSSGLHCICFVI